MQCMKVILRFQVPCLSGVTLGLFLQYLEANVLRLDDAEFLY